jgi:hypothetical protein
MTRQTSIQLTEATERQANALRARGFGTFTDVVRISIDRMYNQETGGREMETQDSGMDRQMFLDWFTGGEKLARTISEDAARADIAMLSADNGHDVSDAEMARYIGWLREEGVIED